ncbi:MAG: hypothetical protein K2W96_23505 [Gemmataceae bacterium]|nr:hypothetical protein [Gemmataceae bacterium]
MFSAALTDWRTARKGKLDGVDAHCATLAALVPPPPLAEEALQGYAMLLGGDFQGFCRALCTECAQAFAAVLPITLQAIAQTQFTAGLVLNTGNPVVKNIREDFDRFGLRLDLIGADPANAVRITHLGHLNHWRNHVAHQKTTLPPVGVPQTLVLADVRDWRASCDGIAASLDGIMYNHLKAVLGTAPW